MISQPQKLGILFALFAAPLIGSAFGHPGDIQHFSHPGFASGFLHPVGGIDHLLAMVAVGLWAAQIGGRAIWAVPASFLFAMLVGGLIGFSEAKEFPLLEQSIAASVFVLGILIAFAIRPPLWLPIVTVAAFAIFHGAAHGAELPFATDALSYTLGFMLCTAALHAIGIALGIFSAQRLPVLVPRMAGGCIAIVGVWLFTQSIAAA